MKRIGALILAPIFFLVLGYSTIYLIGKPVIQLVSSSLELILLSEPPKFETIAKAETNADGTVKKQETVEQKDDKIAASSVTFPKSGEQYGHVRIPNLQVDEPLYYGDSRDILRLGAGQYLGSVYPGELGTTLIGAHNGTSFGRMITLEAGEEIVVDTTYGTYTYKVDEQTIKNYQDPFVKELLAQKNERKLLLYTCYPIYSIGMTPDRIFVTATLTSGPIIE